MVQKSSARTKGRYQLKKERGLVPCQYDLSSKTFNLGAHRHWPSENRSTVHCRKLEAIDRKFLEMARESR